MKNLMKKFFRALSGRKAVGPSVRSLAPGETLFYFG